MPLELPDLAARGQIPEPYRVVAHSPTARSCRPAKTQPTDPARMPLELAELAARGQIPELRAAYAVLGQPSAGQRGLAVRRKGNRSDPARMPLKLAELAARGQIPEPCRFGSNSSPDNAVLPSGEKATELTWCECPSNLRISRPVARSQSLTVLSQLPDSAVLPSGENATELTRARMPQLQHFFDPGRLFGSRLANGRAAQKPQNANRKSQQHDATRARGLCCHPSKLAVPKQTLRERRYAAIRPRAISDPRGGARTTSHIALLKTCFVFSERKIRNALRPLSGRDLLSVNGRLCAGFRMPA